MLNAGVPDSDHCILFAHVPVNVFFLLLVLLLFTAQIYAALKSEKKRPLCLIESLAPIKKDSIEKKKGMDQQQSLTVHSRVLYYTIFFKKDQ